MTRSISQDVLEQLENNEITSFHLLEFEVDGTTYRYTDCEVPIYCQTSDTTGAAYYTFEPRGFTFDNVNYSTNSIVDSCKVRVDNLDSFLTSLFIGNTITEEICKLYMIVYDSDNNIIGVQQIFYGMINDFSIDEESLNMSVTSIFARWDQASNASHSSLCRWKTFKGTECGYDGSASVCDRSYEVCLSYSNQDNFGGFRWLPDIQDKEVWWGVA